MNRTVLTLGLLAACLPAATEPPSVRSPVVAPKPLPLSADELQLLEGLFAEFAAAPEAERTERLAALVERNLGQLESPYARRLLLNNLGRNYAQARRWKEAAASHRRAVEIDGPKDGQWRNAVDGLLTALVQGASDPADYEAGVRLAREELDFGRLTPGERLKLTGRAATLLIFLDRPAEAADVVKALAGPANGDDPAWRKVRRGAFWKTTDVASGMSVNDFKREAYELRLWAEQAYPDLADDLLFLNNLAFAALWAGSRDDAIGHRLRLVERFPDDPRTPDHLVILADDLYDNGESERAVEFYRRVAEHPLTRDDRRARARRGLETASRSRKSIVRGPDGATVHTVHWNRTAPPPAAKE